MDFSGRSVLSRLREVDNICHNRSDLYARAISTRRVMDTFLTLSDEQKQRLMVEYRDLLNQCVALEITYRSTFGSTFRLEGGTC